MDKYTGSQQSREELYESIKQDIDSLIQQINSFEKIRLLGGIGGSINGGIQFLKPTLPNIIETSIEYAESIALALDNDPGLPIPDAENISGILGSLKSVREKYIEYISTENNVTKYTALEQQLRAKVIEKTLTVRGESYDVLVEEVFLELYDQHRDFFLKHYGFAPEAILDTIDYIEEGVKANQILVKQEHQIFLKWFKQQDMKRLAREYGSGNPFLPSIAYQKETGKRPSFKSIDEQFRFVESELTDEQIHILRTLSIQFGENKGFLDPRFPGWPLNDSVVNRKPILFDTQTSSYYCFSTRILHRNLFNITEGLIERADKAYYENVYRSKKQKGKSTYFGQKVFQLFSHIMPSYPIYTNLKYERDGEMDVLIVGRKYTYLVEVKSGSLTNEARRGAIDRLRTDLKKLIQEAATQAARTEEFIRSNPAPSFRLEKNQILEIDKNKPTIKIIVSFASITGITNQLANLAKMGFVSDQHDFPLAISIFDLMGISDVFENNEADFLDYLQARVLLYTEENLIVDDEMDFLGLFLSRDFKKVIKTLKRGERVQIGSEHRNKLDIYYQALYGNKPVKKPKRII